MEMSQTANNYARAIFELGISIDDLNTAKEIFEAAPELMEALCSPAVKAAAKHNIIDKLFPEALRNFLKLLTDYGSTALFYDIYEAYCELERNARGVLSAELIYSAPPTEQQLEGIKRRLMKIWGRQEVDLKLTRDESLIGGFIIKAGDEEIDYSVRGRLAGLSQKLIRR